MGIQTSLSAVNAAQWLNLITRKKIAYTNIVRGVESGTRGLSIDCCGKQALETMGGNTRKEDKLELIS